MVFSNIDRNLADKNPPFPTSHRSFLSGNFSNSIFFDTAFENEIVEICPNFRSGTAAGYYNVFLDLVMDVYI